MKRIRWRKRVKFQQIIFSGETGEGEVRITFYWTALPIPETLCAILSNQERAHEQAP
jgi:hypothetical protein